MLRDKKYVLASFGYVFYPHQTKGALLAMTNQELKKLGRNDLLELLLDQAKVIEQLREELDIANQKLADRKIELDKAGSIAEAALQINGVFNAAQEACAQYMYNITELSQRQEAICAQMERETQMKCDKMLLSLYFSDHDKPLEDLF